MANSDKKEQALFVHAQFHSQQFINQCLQTT